MKMNLLISAFLFLSFQVSAASKCLPFYEGKATPWNKTQVIETPSGRLLKMYVDKSTGLKKGDEIIIAVHGLGKSYPDMKPFIDASLDRNKTVVSVELHGHGETYKLNPALQGRAEIPYQFNVEDLLYVMKQLGRTYKIKLVAHSYGGGIALAALAKIKQENIQLPITKVILLSPFVKNLDKYYADSIISGQLTQVASDLANPILNMSGIPSQWINTYNSLINRNMFAANLYIQQFRDSMLAVNPYFDMWREWLSQGPNATANLTMGPAHIVANTNIKDISKWQQNPMALMQIIMNNIAVINGARNLNFLDFSKPLDLPENIEYKMVLAMNDSVVPNTINQEFVLRMNRAGYNIQSQTLAGENHYYLYLPTIKDLYKSIFE